MKEKNINSNNFNNKGFTLVELLVVISIIGILSSFAVVSLNTARIKARDALRKGDMAQVRTALNLYYDDNLSYPICGTWDDEDGYFGGTPECYLTLDGEFTTGSRPYMDIIPMDPKNIDNTLASNPTYIYRYVSDGNGYAITYVLEDGGEKIMRGW